MMAIYFNFIYCKYIRVWGYAPIYNYDTIKCINYIVFCKIVFLFYCLHMLCESVFYFFLKKWHTWYKVHTDRVYKFIDQYPF